MYTHRNGRVAGHRARGIVAVQALLFPVVILGFAALTVDVGVMYNTRADLQRAADAATLAGASAYTTDAMMRIRQDVGGQDTLAHVTGLVVIPAGPVTMPCKGG